MMRQRLRPTPSPDELDRLYSIPHDHTRWVDHLYRVDVTTAMAGLLLPPGGRVADLSCGDATIARRLEATHGAHTQLGDYAPGYSHTGPIEETIGQIDPVHLFILSETLEHLDDPDMVLSQIRRKTSRLILSTPDGEGNNGNHEHLWGWDAEAVRQMLVGAGFRPLIHTTVDTRPAGYLYSYQIWACE